MAIGCESAVTGAAGSDAEETLESKDISLVVPGFAASAAQWVVTGYAITFGGLLILGGRASDLYGRRRMFLAGIGVRNVLLVVCTVWFLVSSRKDPAAEPAPVSPLATTV